MGNWTEDVEWNHVTLMVNGKLPLEPVSTVVENCFCCHLAPLNPPVAVSSIRHGMSETEPRLLQS